MVIGLMSSVYALDTGQIGCGVETSQTSPDVICVDVSDKAIETVNILHKDTLMHVWAKGEDTKRINVVIAEPISPNFSRGYRTCPV